MPLFARRFREDAREELERKLKEIEKNKKSVPQRDFVDVANALIANIQFARTLNLISEELEHEFLARVEKVLHDRGAVELNRKQEERVAEGRRNNNQGRCMSMDEAREEIRRERERASEQQRQYEKAPSAPTKSTDEEQRTK